MAYVLVVDDDEFMRALLAMTLERAGHVVLLAPNGREAIRLFHEVPVDLVVTDMLMPQMDGLELIVLLKKSRSDLPVIAMSGGSLRSEPYLEQARDLGAAHVLEKPFPVSVLMEAVERALHPAAN